MLHAPPLPLPLSNMPIVLNLNPSQPTPSAQQQQQQDPQHPPSTELEPAAALDQRGRLRQSSRRTLSSQSLVRLKKDVEASLLLGNNNDTNSNNHNNSNNDNNNDSPATGDAVVAGDLQESDLSESRSAALTAAASARLGRKLLLSHSRCPSPTPSGATLSSLSSASPSSSVCASPVLSTVSAITTRSTVVANCRPFVTSAVLVPVSVCAHASPLLEIGNTESFSGNEPVLSTSTSTTTTFSTATTARSLQERRGKENYQPEPRGIRVSRSSSTASTGRVPQRSSESETPSCLQLDSSNSNSNSSDTTHKPIVPSAGNVVAAAEQRNRVRVSTAQETGRMTETAGESHTPVAVSSGGQRENQSKDPIPGPAIPPATPAGTAAVVDVTEKPAISYANLILQAISESPLQRLTLCDIYAWIKDRHPYYQYSSSGWQNSIRHNLSLNKAFQKLERNMGEPGKGCFWTLHEDAHAICAASACKKTKKSEEAPSDNGSLSKDQTSVAGTVRAKSTSASLPRLNCQRQDLRRPTPKRYSSARALTPPESVSGLHTSGNAASLPESVHSPAALDDTEEPMSPRRSGRARRPPRAKEIDEYTVHTPSGASSLSTPPWSPGRDESDDEDKTEGLKESSSEDSNLLSPSESKAKAAILAQAAPAQMTSQRIRRPPQNLADFVSSEDFKAAPYTKRPVGRPPLMSAASSPNLIGDKDRLDRKRSRDDLVKALQNDDDQSEPHSKFDREMKRERSASSAEPASAPLPMSQGSNSTSLTRPPLPHRPASVSLSALSHSKRPSEDFSSRNGKKQRRDAEQRHQERQRSRSGSRSQSSENVYERRRREGKREIMVASEDDWSDSDFDCLRDEEENYRMSLRRAGLDDRRHLEGFGRGSQSDGVGLLLDPSAITYGFDSCDAEYILNFNQGPLFNNVSWPEFSDSKEDALVPASSMADQNETDSQELDYIQKEWALLTANISQGPGSPTDELLLLNNIDLEADEDSPNRSETPEMQLPLRLEDCAMEATHAVLELNKVASSCSSAKEDDVEFLKDYIGWSLCD
ncbi:hypothetical protein EMPS_01775 [Entomortierella parvispora]|uniref:Fork-head domain-containing protein n=1 Tax=Entomortierella parvispora TaxID=205924 RepID=A0A9P3LSZ4_9FUNG|nr:hypothetical protein EMPS_01775 [Entomortierella parvispora]